MTFTWTPHRFSGGALAFDVANSVVLRFDAERRIDRYADPAAIVGFAAAATRFCADRDLFGPLQPVAPENRPAFLDLREATDRHFRAEVLGHPLDVVVWLADHLASIGRGLLRGDVVITGSIITSKFVKAGDRVRFDLEQVGAVELHVD